MRIRKTARRTKPRRDRSECRSPSRDGATAVEFALTAPLVLFIAFACLEFARVNMIRNSAENAAYEGARAGIVPGATADGASATARAVVDHVFTNGETITVEPAEITPNTESVTVTIEIPLDENSWVLPVFFPGKTITARRTLRRDFVETVTVP